MPENKHKSVNILIVDDLSFIAESFKIELDEAGYKVQVATSPKEAIKKIKDNNFDLIYTDYNMPEMNGIELCREIRKINQSSEVVLMSGSQMDIVKYRDEFMRAGGSGNLLKKPLEIGELTSLTQRLVDKIKEVKGKDFNDNLDSNS